MFNNLFSYKLVPFEIMWKNIVERGRQYGMAQAHCMLDNKGYKYALRECNTSRSSTATMIVRTRLSVRLCVHCLSCSRIQVSLWQKRARFSLRNVGVHLRNHMVSNPRTKVF
jgi:hypothetical protein